LKNWYKQLNSLSLPFFFIEDERRSTSSSLNTPWKHFFSFNEREFQSFGLKISKNKLFELHASIDFEMMNSHLTILVCMSRMVWFIIWTILWLTKQFVPLLRTLYKIVTNTRTNIRTSIRTSIWIYLLNIIWKLSMNRIEMKFKFFKFQFIF